jgi:GNAT superfamily N-acetyltransferase
LLFRKALRKARELMDANIQIEVKVASTDAEILACFPAMKLLRPHLKDAQELLLRARRQMHECGWRLVYVEERGVVVGCASFRIAEFLAWGKTIYVDDLVVLESHRGRGIANALMQWIKATGEANGCSEYHLDSGTSRHAAHRFYHRIGFSISAFHFAQKLDAGGQ